MNSPSRSARMRGGGSAEPSGSRPLARPAPSPTGAGRAKSATPRGGGGEEAGSAVTWGGLLKAPVRAGPRAVTSFPPPPPRGVAQPGGGGRRI